MSKESTQLTHHSNGASCHFFTLFVLCRDFVGSTVCRFYLVNGELLRPIGHFFQFHVIVGFDFFAVLEPFDFRYGTAVDLDFEFQRLAFVDVERAWQRLFESRREPRQRQLGYRLHTCHVVGSRAFYDTGVSFGEFLNLQCTGSDAVGEGRGY